MTPRQKKRLGFAAGATLILVTSAFFVLRPAELAVIKPVRQDVVEVVVASGTLRAVRQSMVGAESSGVVESLEVSEGDRVHQGDLLGRLRLGETDARLAGGLAALRAAETTLRGEELQLEQANRDLRRARDLAARKLVPVAELDDAESAFSVQQANTDAARARLAEARAQVDQIRPEFGKREVRAPFNGVVIERMIEPGTSVSAATSWFTIAEMSATEIYVETDENNLGKLKVGQPAIAVAPACSNTPGSTTGAHNGSHPQVATPYNPWTPHRNTELLFDLIAATFPAGTVSGAPKIRAMEIIDELEPVARGLYGGALGYVDLRGNLDFCIAIRTIVIEGRSALVQAGAGIVADSDPAAEYHETRDKARALVRAIELAERGL